MPTPAGDITSEAAAVILGISRRTLWRWIDEGRLDYPIYRAALSATPKRPRGPRRNPNSKRYHEGRHTYQQKASD